MIHNFNAGPSVIPNEVKEKCIAAIQNFNGTGLSILEFGHRTKQFEKIVADAKFLCLELMGLSANDYDLVFLQGGATTQFFQVPMNFLESYETAHFIDTGVWSNKAIKATKDFGKVNIIASSEKDNYKYIPKNFTIPNEGAYLHLTSNNTIYGTQWQAFPKSPLPIVVDMSSDILSQELDYNQFALIYAGAQKNIGIAGCTIVIIKKSFQKKIDRVIPAMLQYQSHIENESMLNTPPVFSIYAAYLTLQWIKEQRGLKVIGERNAAKATLLYDTIDNSKLFKGTVVKEDRSKMNVCFLARDEKTEKAFLEFATQENIYGIKGHRSSGGFRASLYNALSIESVKHLCHVMERFEKQHA